MLDAEISFQSQYRAADGIILQPDSVEISTSAIFADSISFVKTEHLELTNLEQPIQRHVHFVIPIMKNPITSLIIKIKFIYAISIKSIIILIVKIASQIYVHYAKISTIIMKLLNILMYFLK